jgi:hypothetical protein
MVREIVMAGIFLAVSAASTAIVDFAAYALANRAARNHH